MKFPKDFTNTIICGSAVDVMKRIPDDSVHLVITSPPYNLKNSTGNGMKDGRGGKNEMMRIIPEDGAIFNNHKWRVQGGLLQDRQDIMGSSEKQCFSELP